MSTDSSEPVTGEVIDDAQTIRDLDNILDQSDFYNHQSVLHTIGADCFSEEEVRNLVRISGRLAATAAAAGDARSYSRAMGVFFRFHESTVKERMLKLRVETLKLQAQQKIRPDGQVDVTLNLSAEIAKLHENPGVLAYLHQEAIDSYEENARNRNKSDKKG